jgi:Mn-dependent DtxR family transcriptional regulator
MAKVAAFHTNSPEYLPKHREVYHDTDTCPDGKTIQQKHRENGTGNKKICPECDKVS